jgi:hypothetical protein
VRFDFTSLCKDGDQLVDQRLVTEAVKLEIPRQQ